MEKEKIAILIDSGMDVPQEYINRFGMFVVPLLICYSSGEYRDKVDISPDDVFARFKEEIPRTSLPSMETIHKAFDEITAAGYTQILAITISSGLSGTYNAVRMAAEVYGGLDLRMIDTKNIGIAAGFTAITAGQLIEKGLSCDEICIKLHEVVENTAVFFCVETLEYLKKGGRIGLVAAAIGTLLNLKPIISCNRDGVYHAVGKTRGRTQSIDKALTLARNFSQKFDRCIVAIADGGAKAESDELFSRVMELFPNAVMTIREQISPALVVHTGPGLIGIGVQKMIF